MTDEWICKKNVGLRIQKMPNARRERTEFSAVLQAHISRKMQSARHC